MPPEVEATEQPTLRLDPFRRSDADRERDWRSQPTELQKHVRTLQVGKQVRVVQRAEGETDDGFVRLAFPVTSETPVERWYGYEVLGHKPEEVDLTRANNGIGVLLAESAWMDHYGRRAGITEKAWIEDGRCWVQAKFGRDEIGQRASGGMTDEILIDVSAGYWPGELTLVEQKADGPNTYRATRWELLEVTIVNGVPADQSVGYGRSERPDEVRAVRVSGLQPQPQEERTMSPEVKPTATRTEEPVTAAPAAGGAAKRKYEAPEIRAINELCDSNSIPVEKRNQWIDEGLTVFEVSHRILSESKTPAGRAQPAAEVVEQLPTMTRKEAERYSIRNAIDLDVQRRAGKRVAGFEIDYDQQARRNLPNSFQDHGGIIVPLSRLSPDERRERDLEQRWQRTMGTGIASGGAALVTTVQGELIDAIRARNILQALGARILTDVVGMITWPKVTAEPTFKMMKENPGTGAAKTNPQYGWILSGPKMGIGNVAIPRQLIASTSHDVEADVERRLAIGYAAVMDKMGWHGKGTDMEPTGLFNLADIQPLAMGGAPTFAKLVKMIGMVPDGTPGTIAYATTRLMAAQLAATLKVANSGVFCWEGALEDGRVAGYRAASSDQISKTLGGGSDHGLIAGPFDSCLFPMWGGLELVTDAITLADQGGIRVIAYGMFDFVCEYPEAFVSGTGATVAA
jgi:HK97 family phage major capsid protein